MSKATGRQIGLIHRLAGEKGITLQEIANAQGYLFGYVGEDTLSKAEATETIKWLMTLPRKRRARRH